MGMMKREMMEKFGKYRNYEPGEEALEIAREDSRWPRFKKKNKQEQEIQTECPKF